MSTWSVLPVMGGPTSYPSISSVGALSREVAPVNSLPLGRLQAAGHRFQPVNGRGLSRTQAGIANALASSRTGLRAVAWATADGSPAKLAIVTVPGRCRRPPSAGRGPASH